MPILSENMNVHHLELFFFVAKFEGITNAVRKMPYGIQQPAVSGQILQLEKSLGVKLFNRRPFILTKAGEKMYDYIYPFFSKMSEMESKIKGEERNTLRLAASASVLKTHLPVVLGIMKQENPLLKLQLKEVEPTEIEKMIQDEEVDLALAALGGEPEGNLKMEKLLDLSIALFVKAKSPENDFESLLVNDEYEKGRLIKYPIIELFESQVLGKVFDSFMNKQGVSWKADVKVSSLEVVFEYVAQGFGVGLGFQVPGKKVPEGIKIIPLTGCPRLTLGVIYQGKPKPLVKQFIEKAHEAAIALREYT